MPNIRQEIYNLIQNINPLDSLEETHQGDALNWIDSGAEIFRISKPDNPPKHLVSYFVVVDGDHVLLVDHKKAGLWLPSGGHVEMNEHPKDTVKREIREELDINADFLFELPQFVTVSETVGSTAGHTDVSLWYVVKGDKSQEYVFDEDEFNAIEWFHMDEIPFEKSDPHMKRMIEKLKLVKGNSI